MLDALGEEVGPVTEAAEHDACVDEVEMGGGIGPGLFDVVDLVFDVRGRPAGLDGGKIDAVDLQILDGPFPLDSTEHRTGNSTSTSG